MESQVFDFESFNAAYEPAVSGLRDVMTAVKGIIPDMQEVATQTGSEKLKKTTESAVQIIEEMVGCFASVEESADEVKEIYRKIDNSVN